MAFDVTCIKQEWCRGIVIKHADSKHRGCQFDSSMCHSKRKATGSHLMNSTSLKKLKTLPLASATLEIECATQEEVQNNLMVSSDHFAHMMHFSKFLLELTPNKLMNSVSTVAAGYSFEFQSRDIASR